MARIDYRGVGDAIALAEFTLLSFILSMLAASTAMLYGVVLLAHTLDVASMALLIVASAAGIYAAGEAAKLLYTSKTPPGPKMFGLGVAMATAAGIVSQAGDAILKTLAYSSVTLQLLSLLNLGLYYAAARCRG